MKAQFTSSILFGLVGSLFFVLNSPIARADHTVFNPQLRTDANRLEFQADSLAVELNAHFAASPLHCQMIERVNAFQRNASKLERLAVAGAPCDVMLDTLRMMHNQHHRLVNLVETAHHRAHHGIDPAVCGCSSHALGLLARIEDTLDCATRSAHAVVFRQAPVYRPVYVPSREPSCGTHRYSETTFRYSTGGGSYSHGAYHSGSFAQRPSYGFSLTLGR
jgi:hypothetical protein